MALSKVRIQLLDEKTGAVIEEVDVLTSPECVLFGDGKTLLDKLAEISKQEGPKGDPGQRGSQWFQGTGITGTSTTPAVYAQSGVAAALVNDMYLNTDTSTVYVCTTAGNAGTAKWKYSGSIKGAMGATGAKGEPGTKGDPGAKGAQGEKGEPGIPGTKGATGQRGSQWFQGTGITGTSTTATAFANSGVASALVGDMYLNTSTGNVYTCTVAGNASAAKWVYKGCIKGVTGAQGPKGDPGTNGAAGPVGPAGPAGKDGDTIKCGTSYETATEVKLFLKKV